MRRWLARALAGVLIAGVGGGIWLSASEQRLQAESRQQLSLRGLIGSEKSAFFADPRVQAALAAQGLTVAVDKAGSRSIATQADPSRDDFAFPSGAPAAAQIAGRAGSAAAGATTPFYTPMVVASWQPVAEILVANGVARRDGALRYTLDLGRLMALMSEGRRWKDLTGSAAFPSGKSVLVASTDLRSSNSASMYLALLSYAANHEQVVRSRAEVEAVVPQVADFFLRQGFQDGSSSEPFQDFLALGMGKTPLLLAYESQLVQHWLQHRPAPAAGSAPTAGGGGAAPMVVLYPQPTLYSKHVLVPFNEGGRRLARALDSDPTLRELAQEHGFRTSGQAQGPAGWRARGVDLPDSLVDVIDPPSQEWLESMITGVLARQP
ncbi:MAG: hypothetical protein RLY78_1677 [Pseudomonadota bacterium]